MNYLVKFKEHNIILAFYIYIYIYYKLGLKGVHSNVMRTQLQVAVAQDS